MLYKKKKVGHLSLQVDTGCYNARRTGASYKTCQHIRIPDLPVTRFRVNKTTRYARGRLQNIRRLTASYYNLYLTYTRLPIYRVIFSLIFIAPAGRESHAYFRLTPADCLGKFVYVLWILFFAGFNQNVTFTWKKTNF